MNLPNRLSLLRIILVPVMAILFLLKYNWSVITAVCVFVIACFTDFLDGHIARKYNMVTDLGKLLDPIADKMLVCFGLFLVVEANCFNYGVIPQGVASFCAAIIICRELLISVVRQIGASKGIIIHANVYGKIKTMVQYVAIPAMMLLVLNDAITSISGMLYAVLYWFAFGAFAVATILTVLSAIVYLVQNKSVFKS